MKLVSVPERGLFGRGGPPEISELGGRRFLLGDGGLRYGRENLVESYYNAHIWRGLFVGPDVQYASNPGYSRIIGLLGGCRRRDSGRFAGSSTKSSAKVLKVELHSRMQRLRQE